MEMEDHELRAAYMRGKIESLQFLLKVVVATLPENHRAYVSRRLSELSKDTEETAIRQDTDPARDFASAVHDTRQYFEAYIDDEADNFADREKYYGIS